MMIWKAFFFFFYFAHLLKMWAVTWTVFSGFAEYFVDAPLAVSPVSEHDTRCWAQAERPLGAFWQTSGKAAICLLLRSGFHLTPLASVPFPRSVPWDNSASEVWRQFLWLHAWFVLWRALSTVGPYIDRCVFAIHVQPTEFTGIFRKHLSSILKFTAKAVNTYIRTIFLGFSFKIIKNIYIKRLFLMLS